MRSVQLPPSLLPFCATKRRRTAHYRRLLHAVRFVADGSAGEANVAGGGCGHGRPRKAHQRAWAFRSRVQSAACCLLLLSRYKTSLLRKVQRDCSVPRMSKEGSELINAARDKYLNMLSELVHKSHPASAFTAIARRISRLMMLLPAAEVLFPALLKQTGRQQTSTA